VVAWGRKRATPAIVIGTRRVVCVVEVDDHVSVVGRRQVEVASRPVGLLAREGIPERQEQLLLALWPEQRHLRRFPIDSEVNDSGAVVDVLGGDLAGARKSFNDSLAIIERLATSDPGNALWQRDLSASYDRVGDVQKAQGDLAGALKSYSDGLVIAEGLAKSDPGNAKWQRDLAMSFGELASVHRQSGDRAKALDALRQGQAIMSRLTKLSPDNAQWKQDLAEFNQDITELAPLRLEHGRNPRNPLSRR